MAIDFPSSPSVGQTYTFNGRTWQYNAQGGWQRVPLNLLMNDIPDGRLTLTSGTPVLTSTVSGASTIYYTPYCGNNVPIYDGTNWTLWTFSELSQTLADATKSPGATSQDSCYDLFVWNDSGTLRLSRGPQWIQQATITVTIATPGVVTWTGHPLHDGSPVVFTTTGALPTGLAQNTFYYATKVDANTFKLSTTVANQVAGTFINTSGTQSGTHTGYSTDTGRSTGAGTSELTRVNGILMNANSITNGPAAQRGTYVGTIRTNPSNTVDFILGGLAASGTAGVIYLWNMYNRVPWAAFSADSTDTWTYATTTWRAANASATIRTSFVIGQQEDIFRADYQIIASQAGGFSGRNGIGYDTLTTYSGFTGLANATTASAADAVYQATPAIGWHYMAAIEFATGATITFNGDAGAPTSLQTGIYVGGRY